MKSLLTEINCSLKCRRGATGKTREPQKLDSVGSSPTAGTTLESHQEDLFKQNVGWQATLMIGQEKCHGVRGFPKGFMRSNGEITVPLKEGVYIPQVN